MPRTVAFCTLGCKVNQYDSQAMLELFERAGFVAAPFSAPADVYVVNTCTVTGTGDKKSRQMIRRAHRTNPQADIVVTGCMAQRAAQSLLLPGVRLVLGTQRRGEIVALLEAARAGGEPMIAVEPLDDAPFEALTVRRSEGRTRATLKIQEGCQNHCAYCIIPSVRGPIRSRPLDEIEGETARLVQSGFAEIVVTGIHLSSYGRDLPQDVTLLDALRQIAGVPGVRRIRLGSLEPGIVTPAFVEGLQGIAQICPQFMLALQSGSDTVLARMGRRYNTAQYARAAALLCGAYPHASLTTDVMCGFPGETDEEFTQTMAFVAQIGFARIHVFPYSEREGTRAAAMPGRVPQAIREARASQLIALGDELAQAYLRGWIGQRCEVLFEEACKGGAVGYSREYVRVMADGTPGHIQTVAIDGLTDGREPVLHGHVIEASE